MAKRKRRNIDLQNITQKTKDWATQNLLKTRGELRFLGRASSSCSTSGTGRDNLAVHTHTLTQINVINSQFLYKSGGRRGCDGIVVGFTTTYAINDYHHWCCEFESRPGRAVLHYVIKFISDLWKVGGLFHQ
jgi:hypothetical protein